MYTPDQFLKAIRNPRAGLLELNRLYHRRLRGQSGIKVMDADWDNLIILDACRYDLFVQENTLEGELKSVISSDSSTSGFLQYNFGNETFPDTVYVAANPQVQRHNVGGQFHETRRLWETYWDDDLKTVLPSDVTDVAAAMAAEYPNKRLIVHYIQPHYPFIGQTGRKIEHGSITGDGVVANDRETRSIWTQLEAGTVDEDIVWEAYRENLQLALPEVKRLLESLQGKTVITSDHGNAFGELGVYGHPGGTFIEPLVSVPWLTIVGSERKTIEQGEVEKAEEGVQDVNGSVSERLKDLGYV